MKTTPISRQSTAQLAKAAFSPTGKDRKGGEAARAELNRRIANGSKFAPKVMPTVATAPVVSPAKITPAQVATVAKAAKVAGLGSRGGDLRKRLASEAARRDEGGFSRDARNTYYALALDMSDADVKSDLRELGFTVA